MSSKQPLEKYLTREEAYRVFATKQEMFAMEARINSNVLELLKIGLTPLYKKLDIELPSQFLN